MKEDRHLKRKPVNQKGDRMKLSITTSGIIVFALSSSLFLGCGAKKKDEAKEEEEQRARVLAKDDRCFRSKPLKPR